MGAVSLPLARFLDCRWNRLRVLSFALLFSLYVSVNSDSDDEALPKIILETERELRDRHYINAHSARSAVANEDSHDVSNEWVVQSFGGPETVKRLARDLNYQYVGPVRSTRSD